MTSNDLVKKKTGRPTVAEIRKNHIFKALNKEWEDIQKNAKNMNYSSASDYIRETTLNIPKWFNTKCFDAILNKNFKQIEFEKDEVEKTVIVATENSGTIKYIITHVVGGIERVKIELDAKEDIAVHLDQNGYRAEMLTSKN